MSLLTICQNVAAVTGAMARPSAIIGANDEDSSRLLACCNRAGKSLAKYDWLSIRLTITFPTISGLESYLIPGDFDRFVPDTHWDATNNRRIIGPTSPQEWQLRRNSTIAVSVSTRKHYRIERVLQSTELYLDPIPDTTGEQLTFEYISKHWCENTANVRRSEWANDTDVGIIDEYLIELETQWRFLQSLGLPYGEAYNESKREVLKAYARDGGMTVLPLARRRNETLLSSYNVPDSGYGS